MELFKNYLRNIVVYLIFDAFIGIILTSDKYKKYISLVSGFVLILIMLMPINSFLSHNNSYNFSRHKDFDNRFILEVQNEAVKKQISSIAENSGIKISGIEIKNSDCACVAEISGLKIKLASNFIDNQYEKKFRKTLCLLYNLENDNINFECE